MDSYKLRYNSDGTCPNNYDTLYFKLPDRREVHIRITQAIF
jgi:hypothetical protein